MINILVALVLTFFATIVSRHLFEYNPHGIVIVGLYFLFYALISLIRSSDEAESFQNDQQPDRSDWPLSGPYNLLGQKTGALIFLAVFWFTNILSLLNPFQFLEVIRQLIGNARLKRREKQSNDNNTDYQTKTNYCLPFRGEWLVYNGGYTPETSHSWDILTQRFALDFVQVDESLSRHSGRGTQLNDYYCYGEEIIAASDGTVISIENRISDAPFVGYGVCDFTARSFIGNYVIIQHADNEYALYAHLIKGSVCVRTGEKVNQGQIIGRCGHSGHSSEPHLHFHLQDSPDIFKGMGLPVTFSQIEIDRKITTNCYIKASQKVHNILLQQSNAKSESAHSQRSKST